MAVPNCPYMGKLIFPFALGTLVIFFIFRTCQVKIFGISRAHTDGMTLRQTGVDCPKAVEYRFGTKPCIFLDSAIAMFIMQVHFDENSCPTMSRKECYPLRNYAILLSLSLVLVSGCRQSKQAESNAPAPVEVSAATLVGHPETVTVSGSVVSPNAPADVPFLVSGRVLRVIPREGDHVRKGQELAVIDATEYSLSVNAATAQVAAAKIALDRAEDEYKRMKSLFEEKSLPANEFRKYDATYLSAKEQYAGAIAQEQTSKKHVADTRLLAPMEGYISKRSIEPGNMAAIGVSAFQIVELNPVEVQVGVPETSIHLVRLGQSAQVRIPAQPSETFTGKVHTINVSADTATRTYATRIQVPNPKQELRVGMIAEVQIRGDHTVNALTVPGSAIVHDAQGADIVFVYYPNQKRVYSRHVEVGTVIGKEVQISSGIKPDDQVVTSGQQLLRDGAEVQIIGSKDASLKPEGVEHK